MKRKNSTENRVAQNVREGCICLNQSRPDTEGYRHIDPCCRVHYAEQIAFIRAPNSESDADEIEDLDWQHREKKRVVYPKMKVAKP